MNLETEMSLTTTILRTDGGWVDSRFHCPQPGFPRDVVTHSVLALVELGLSHLPFLHFTEN